MKTFLNRSGSERQPFFSLLLYQAIRVVKQFVNPTFQTVRSVNKIIGEHFQTIRMAMNEFTFYHATHFQTRRVIQLLFQSKLYQTVREISLWVLPTNLYGQFKREGETIVGRFKRK